MNINSFLYNVCLSVFSRKKQIIYEKIKDLNFSQQVYRNQLRIDLSSLSIKKQVFQLFIIYTFYLAQSSLSWASHQKDLKPDSNLPLQGSWKTSVLSERLNPLKEDVLKLKEELAAKDVINTEEYIHEYVEKNVDNYKEKLKCPTCDFGSDHFQGLKPLGEPSKGCTGVEVTVLQDQDQNCVAAIKKFKLKEKDAHIKEGLKELFCSLLALEIPRSSS